MARQDASWEPSEAWGQLCPHRAPRTQRPGEVAGPREPSDVPLWASAGSEVCEKPPDTPSARPRSDVPSCRPTLGHSPGTHAPRAPACHPKPFHLWDQPTLPCMHACIHSFISLKQCTRWKRMRRAIFLHQFGEPYRAPVGLPSLIHQAGHFQAYRNWRTRPSLPGDHTAFLLFHCDYLSSN